MKLFKEIELYLNLILIGTFAFSMVVLQKGDLIFLSYFAVGAVQIVSMIIHELNSWFTTKKSTRRYYHWITLTLILLFPTGFSFWLLLYTAPFFALFYTYICWKELDTLRFKEFIHLK